MAKTHILPLPPTIKGPIDTVAGAWDQPVSVPNDNHLPNSDLLQ